MGLWPHLTPEIDMLEVIKPIPDSPLHNESDASLKTLINYFRDDMQIRPNAVIIEHHANKIDEIYKVLGYRCALEYIKQYGD
jgi:hypothetical protein